MVKFDIITSGGAVYNSAQEKQHAFQIQGSSWSKEIDALDSPHVAEQPLGVAEAFNLGNPMDAAALASRGKCKRGSAWLLIPSYAATLEN